MNNQLKAKTAEEIAVEHDLIEIYDGDKHRVDPEAIAAMQEFAEQARKEERGKIKSEMENLKFTAEDMAVFADWYSMNWDLDFKPDAALKQWLEERRKTNDKA